MGNTGKRPIVIFKPFAQTAQACQIRSFSVMRLSCLVDGTFIRLFILPSPGRVAPCRALLLRGVACILSLIWWPWQTSMIRSLAASIKTTLENDQRLL